MAVIVRTAREAREEGLKVPAFVAKYSGDPEEYLLVHDPDDGNLLAWGPPTERAEVESLAKMYA